MSPEQQRTAIAEACGHQGVHTIWQDCGNNTGYDILVDGSFQPIADYLNDLNAMHEAEKTLTDDQWDLYTDYLCGMTSGGWSVYKSCAHSPAAQRAEAFLRTIGKWTEQN